MLPFVLVFLATLLFARGERPTTIETYLGQIKGVRYTEPSTRKTIYEFRKIPYAKPPLQNLRFASPRLYGKWLGTLDATKYGPSCYQNSDSLSLFAGNRDISENCLFLNIYVPNSVSKNNKMPVMVLIHGGNYSTGSSNSLNGASLACTGDVIVVTINYRLGVFGFLSTGDGIAHGNYGLLDQRLAILWVRLYISSFGGDPKSITVFGHSAGAMSITLHSLFKKNDKMFRRAILQSGFGTSQLALSKHVPKYTKQIGTFLNCPTNNSLTMLKCLRNSTSQDLQNAFSDVTNRIDEPIMSPLFGPRVCGKYVLDEPEISLRNAEQNKFFQSLDLLIGNVDEEGSTYIKLLEPFQSQYNFDMKKGIPRSVICDKIAPLAATRFYSSSSAVRKAICDKYGNESTLTQETKNQIEFYGDMMYFSHTQVGIDARNTSSKTFQYLFKRELPLRIHPFPDWINGATHGTDLYYLFHFSDILANFPQDLNLAQTVIKYWANFAKTGDVNGRNLPNWPEYDITNKKYAVLDVNVTIQQDLYKDRTNFWLNDIPSIIKEDNETMSSTMTSVSRGTSEISSTGSTPTGITESTTYRSSELTTKPAENRARRFTTKVWSIIFVILAIQY